MATKEGGATPMKVPSQNGLSETLMTGETMLINQFGKNGVILKGQNLVTIVQNVFTSLRHRSQKV